MISTLLALANLTLAHANVCTPIPTPAMEKLEGALTGSNEVTSEMGLRARRVNNNDVLVTTSDPFPAALTLNGSSSQFSWTSIPHGSAVLLTACGLGDAALGFSAEPHFIEWAGPGFHRARPETLVDAVDLRTLPFESVALGATREIYIHIPSGWSGADGDPLIVSGDGLAGSDFARIAATLAADGRIRPTAFVSARFGEGWLGEARTDQRSAEYVAPGPEAHPGRSAAYRAHEAFFFDEFLPFVRAELGGETGPVIAFGMSASATFALEQGLKRPQDISAVIAASPPVTDVTRALASGANTHQAIHVWCGAFEPIFCEPLQALSTDAGFTLEVRQAAHTTPLWEEALASSLLLLAPPPD